MLNKYLHNPSHVLNYESLDVNPKLMYKERSIKILDRKDKVLRNELVPLVKVLWRNQVVEKTTWRQRWICEKDIWGYFKFRRRKFHKLEGLLHPRFLANCGNRRVSCRTLRLCVINGFDNERYDIVD